MPDARTLDILRQLRQIQNVSQTDMAAYFGFRRSARTRMSKWEVGSEVPPLKHRERFILYLIDKLRLRNNPERFNDVWQILCKEWNWPSLTERER
jgi:hypothetical protein